MSLSVSQRALVGALEGSGALSGWRVFAHEAPKSFKLKHIIVGQSTSVPKGTFGQAGSGITETIDVYTPGPSMIEAKDGLELVHAALEATPEGLADCRPEGDFEGPSDDAWSHAFTRYRVWVRS